MGLSRITAVEIFSNAKDLTVSIQEKKGQYAIFIARGPGHNFKILISSGYGLKKDEALKLMREFLEISEKEGSRILTENDGLLAAAMNPRGRPVEELTGRLTPELIERIIQDLGNKGLVETHQYV